MFRDSEANAPIHPLHDVNALEKRTQINEFAWGGALGAAATVSLFSLYSFFSAVYSLNGFKDEMNKLNCIAKSPIPSEIGILLSWFSYTSLTAMMFGTINVLYRAYEKRYPSPSKGGTEQANINELMRLIVTENVMETSWKQISLVSIPLTIFTLSNLNYVQTFLHIADQAIALLPTWGFTHGPAVADDVVQLDQHEVMILGQRMDAEADQGIIGQVEAGGGLDLQTVLGGLLILEVFDANGIGGLGEAVQTDDRFAVLQGHAAAQGFVAGQDL